MIKPYEDVKTKDHDEWEDKCDYDKGEPCLICGRPVKPTANMKMLRLVCAGRFITDNEGAFADDMGWYPVGNTCYAKFVKERHETRC